MESFVSVYNLFVMIFSLLFGISVALTVCSVILDKNHNKGDSIGEVPNYSKEGVTFYHSDDKMPSEPRLSSVHNPRMVNEVETYQASKAQTLDEMIDNEDLSGIQWHK